MGTAVGTGVSITYGEETTRGVAFSGTPSPLRATVRNINLKKDTLESQEVSLTRQRTDVRHGFNRVEATFGYELGLNSFNDVIAYAMGQDNGNALYPNTANGTGLTGWFQPATATTIVSVTWSDTTNATVTQLTRSSGNWIEEGYRPGDWVTLTGFTGAGVYQIVAIPAGDKINIANNGVTISGTNQTVAYTGRKTKIGTTLKTMTIERSFKDSASATVVTQIFRGCAPNTLSMSIQPGQLIGGELGIIGMSATLSGGTSLGAPSAGFSNSPFSAFDGSLSMASQGYFSGTAYNGIVVGAGGASQGATSVPLSTGLNETAVFKKGDIVRFSNSSHAGVLYVVQADQSFTASQNASISIQPPLVAGLTATTDSVAIDYSAGATVTGIDWTLDNQRTLFPVVGSKFSSDVYEGVAKVTGTINLMLTSIAQLSLFENEITPGFVSVRFNDIGGTDFMSIVWYRMKLLQADIDPPQNGPVIINSGFEALEQTFVGSSTTFKEVMHIQRSV